MQLLQTWLNPLLSLIALLQDVVNPLEAMVIVVVVGMDTTHVKGHSPHCHKRHTVPFDRTPLV